MESNGYVVLNGRTMNDSPANFTFVNNIGKSTIDLVWCNLVSLQTIIDFEVIVFPTSSDHFPVKIKLKKNSHTIDLNKKRSFFKWKKETDSDYKHAMSASTKL